MPGLNVPVLRVRRTEKLGPRLAVFKSFSEIVEGEDTAEKYWQVLNEAPIVPSLSTLSAVNLILALAAIDHGSHRALNHTFIREEYLRKLAGLCQRKVKRDALPRRPTWGGGVEESITAVVRPCEMSGSAASRAPSSE